MLFVTPTTASYQLNYDFTNSEGINSNLSIYQGQFLFVDAFATWCDSCRTEMAHLLELYGIIKDNISMISLSVDPESDNIEKVLDFKAEFNAPWDFGLDHTSSFLQAHPIVTYPSTYLFDTTGKLVLSWVGITTTSRFVSDIQQFVNIDWNGTENDDFGVYLNSLFKNPLFQGSGLILGISAIILYYKSRKN
ncbi:MAG: TlpA family protein disulfide reductase [Candidatus Hodarchaeales archaeon]|jgi:thiol-disulfide isomerase/thioredoxin